MKRVVGYTRELVSVIDSSADFEQLKEAGADGVFVDQASEDPRVRSALADCLRSLEAGDLLVVTSSARLSHSVVHFVSTLADLDRRGVLFRSLTEPALSTGADNSTDPAHVVAAIDALRRQLRSLETKAGMTASTNAGRRAGRPTVMTTDRTAIAQELRNQGRSFSQIGRALDVSASAVQRALTQRPELTDSWSPDHPESASPAP